MNILFIGYWGANEGLSQSTINPHLKILTKRSDIMEIHYISMEREAVPVFRVPENDKIHHHPFFCSKGKIRVINKFMDLINLYRLARKIIREVDISIIFCRTSLAGIIGHMLYQKTNIPYTVESFEPHAAYMLDAEVWSKTGISYQFQQWFEARQKETASYLLPVAQNFTEQLKSEGIPDHKLITAPCAVDLEQFQFQQNQRERIRDEHKWQGKTIGIYVGKFGGIYLKEEAFRLFQIAFATISDFNLVLLTPMDSPFVREMLRRYEIDHSRVWFGLVKHEEVPHWLSASDFAFSLHSPTPSKQFVSPIKNGEYWANGLPVMMPEGIGDDSDLLKQHPEAGEVFHLHDQGMKKAIENVQQKLGNRSRVTTLASQYRSFKLIENAYDRILVGG